MYQYIEKEKERWNDACATHANATHTKSHSHKKIKVLQLCPQCNNTITLEEIAGNVCIYCHRKNKGDN